MYRRQAEQRVLERRLELHPELTERLEPDEVLDIAMQDAWDRARYYMPSEMLGQPNENADEVKFREWRTLACKYASDLLPYRKPALRAVLSQQLGPLGDLGQPKSRDDILKRIEERAGEQGRKLMEQFFRKIDKLDEPEVI